MSDKNTYQWMPDNEMLRRFYEGKLSAGEQSALSAMFEKDEFLREAFAQLNVKEFDVVENISLSVNEKLKSKWGRPPFYWNWKIWLSVFVGVLALSSFLAFYDFNSDKKENKLASTDNDKKEEKSKAKAVKRPKTITVQSFYMTEGESRITHGETTMNFHSEEDKKITDLKNSDAKTNDHKTNTAEEKSEPDGPQENKLDQKIKENKVENPSTIDPGKKSFRIRVEEVAVLQLENLAEKEANDGGDRSNVDVRNVNIGDPASTKKNKSYNLEDMPQYKGGNEALAGYVKGKIALKSYTLSQSNVSTVVEFVVTSKGKVEDIQFQNPLDPTMEKDIKEVLSNVTFSPGKKSGKKGSMVYRMAMMFE